jgi:iron complex transport system substrate-binding protein
MKGILFQSVLLAVAVFLSTSTDALTVVDKLGRTVTVQTPVKRAVLFETYELSAGLGIWDRLAGVSRYAYENDLMLAVKPDIARTMPSAGSGFDVNIEGLLKLKPDLVLTWTTKPEIVRFMEEKGLTVIAVYPESLAELKDVLRLQGKLFNREDKVERIITNMESVFDLIKKRVSHIPAGKRLKAIWLNGRPTAVSGNIGINNDIFGMINAVNAASELKERSSDVSIERIIGWNPDVVFIWGSAKYNAEDLSGSPQWRHVNAVKNGKVYKAPKWSTWSPRLAIIALWMAMKTYPDQFRDVDLEKTAENYYQSVYGVSYRSVNRIEN